MDDQVMRVNLPGLLREKNRNGTLRLRVRVEGDKGRKMTLPVGVEHPDFLEHYYAARAGRQWKPEEPRAVERSIDWLASRYLDFLTKMVESNQMSEATLRQRKSVLHRLCDFQDPDGNRYGDFDMDAPTAAFVAIRDAWADRPGAADNLIKTIKAVYQWSIERGEMPHNPAAGIATINKKTKGGAVPWTLADLKSFRKKHPKGTTAHLWLTIQAFTACRIGDAIWIGRDNERTINGEKWLHWQPRKKGSAEVTIPMLAPLYEATRGTGIIGSAYLLTAKGRPFASAESLRNQVRIWCDDAGLQGKSSHGIRKAVAEMMAESGATQHQIMAVMAHTQAKTSEIYTKGVERRALAAGGLQALRNLKW